MEQNNRGIPSLDGLRAISIILMIISHVSVDIYRSYSASFTSFTSILQTLFLVGNLGVITFFVISGFLITSILLREEYINLRKFYFRRTLRIFVPYYFYLLVMVGLTVGGFLMITRYNFLAAFTYTKNYFFDETAPDSWFLAHTWTLSVEEQFYLLFPGVLYLLGKKRGLIIIGAVLVCCPLFRLIYVIYNPEISVEFGRFETVADSLAIGCCLAFLRESLHRKKWYENLMRSNLLLIAPFLALFIATWGHFPKYYNKMLFVLIAITIENICIALFLDWAVTNYDGKLGKFLNARPVAYLGLISYSMYLWQQPILSANVALPIPLKLVLILLISLFSYYLIEKPSLRLRSYLENKKSISRFLTGSRKQC